MKTLRSASKIALLLALAIPAVSFAEKPDKPTTRPMNKPEGFYPKAPRPGRDFGPGPGPRASKEEIETAAEFAKTNFPNFYDMYSHFPENGPMHNAVGQRMVMRYRNMTRQQDQNPDLYDALLAQAKLEDEALGYFRDMRTSKSDAAKADAEAKLHKTAGQVVEKNFSERQQQIEKLRARLADLERQMKDDQENKDQLIAEQLNKTQQEFDRMFRGNFRGQGQGQGPDGVNALQK